MEVLKVGTQRPKRVKVRFTAEEDEGREEWVPPARLRAPWAEKDTWLEAQRQWAELTQDAPDQDDPGFRAANLVFDTCPLNGRAEIGYNLRVRGLLFLQDIPGLCRLLGVSDAFFLADPRSQPGDDGTIIAPWPTTLATAQFLARVHAEVLLSELARMEERAQQRAIYGQHYPGRGKTPDSVVSPEVCAEVDAEFRQAWDLVSGWCGTEALDSRDELAALRIEVVRIGKLMEEAITALRAAGKRDTADYFAKRLGVPLDVVRNAELSGQ
ncbi:hypothetical protein [Streptacidiphilus neutrinimicus]|uniref:hypothetical protein n=1 Tax=Streptacidiphilus neutrinimicus TaxID=105420 RepID=UPI0005A92244|nr:hypothetical protein [Streptacidiphilus neutrinimicus]